jgi:hypothetical protein
MSQQCVWQNNHAILQGTMSKPPRPKQQTKQLAFTMSCQLVSQLQPSHQVTKASINPYGTTQTGATAPSNTLLEICFLLLQRTKMN